MREDAERFYDGQEVSGLVWPDDSFINVEMPKIKKITVVMETGQMAPVAWFAVWDENGIIVKHNGAHVATVEL